MVIVFIIIIELISVSLDPTLINYMFLILGFSLLGYMLIGEGSNAVLPKCIFLAKFMKIYAIFIIILSVGY
jgi:hypothetical protein